MLEYDAVTSKWRRSLRYLSETHPADHADSFTFQGVILVRGPL